MISTTRIIAIGCLLFGLATAGWAEPQARIEMDLEDLEAKADEVVSVNLEGDSLNLGQKLLAVRKGVSAPIKNLVKGIKGVYLRRLWFSHKKAYSREDVDAIHSQLQGPGWVQTIGVNNRSKTEAVSVYSYVENDQVAGVTVISEEAQELTVINIVGPVDLEALLEMGEAMGLPVMKLATTELSSKKTLPPKPTAPLPAVGK